VIVGSAAAFAGTWWLERGDVEAELRGTARVLAMDLSDRMHSIRELSGAEPIASRSDADLRWCVRSGLSQQVLVSRVWQRRCSRLDPTLNFDERLQSLLDTNTSGLFWPRSDRKLLASRLSHSEWFDVVDAVTEWERFRKSGGWFTRAGTFRTHLVDEWFDEFGMYRRGGRRQVLDFQLAAQRVALALELGYRALQAHAS
jgi:hypothetical protein